MSGEVLRRKGKMTTKTVAHISEVEGAYLPAKWMGSDFRYCGVCGEADEWLIVNDDFDIAQCDGCYWRSR